MATTAAPSAPAGTSPLSPKQVLIGLAVGYVICVALLAVKIDRAFGLPAHPLLIHIPVIFDPLLALSTIVLVVRDDWRRRFGTAWGLAAIIALAGTVVAAGAGEKFYDERPFISSTLHDHKEAADTLKILMFALAAFVLLMLWRDLHGGLLGLRIAAAVVGIALAGAAGFFTVRTGHLGAKSVWQREGGGGGGGGFPGGPGGGAFPSGGGQGP